MYNPSKAERAQGLTCACYAQVYLDNTLVNSGGPTEPYDVNAIPAEQIEAIEFYASPAQTPAKYGRPNSACGVLVIHKRRPN